MTVFIGPTILLTCALLFLPYWIVIQVQFLTHRSNYDTWNKWQILFIGTYVVMLVASTLGFVAAFVKSRMLYVVATAVAAVSLLAQIGTEVRLFLYDHHEWPSGNWAWLCNTSIHLRLFSESI